MRAASRASETIGNMGFPDVGRQGGRQRSKASPFSRCLKRMPQNVPLQWPDLPDPVIRRTKNRPAPAYYNP